MGADKQRLPFGSETLLERVVRRLGGVVGLRIIVGAADGKLPVGAYDMADEALGERIVHARDRVSERGPLEGLSVGLAIAASRSIDLVYVTACDAPLLLPGFVERLFELAAGHDAAVPKIDDRVHPLAAVYATRLSGPLENTLKAGERRAQALAELGDTRWVIASDLLDVDPRFDSLRNVNTPEDYAAALSEAHLDR